MALAEKADGERIAALREMHRAGLTLSPSDLRLLRESGGAPPMERPSMRFLGLTPEPIQRSVQEDQVQTERWAHKDARLLAVGAIGLPASGLLVLILVGGTAEGLRAARMMMVWGAIALLAWLYRVHANALAGSPGAAVARPIEAVYAWLIPVANLYLPYHNMKRLWLACRGPRGLAIVGAWWVATLVTVALVVVQLVGGMRALVAPTFGMLVLELALTAWVVVRLTMARPSQTPRTP